jgi:hypothetical protein
MARPNLPVNLGILSNPTLLTPTQFVAPFNILPDVIYTNPTAGRLNSLQFRPSSTAYPTYQGNPTLSSTNFATVSPFTYTVNIPFTSETVTIRPTDAYKFTVNDNNGAMWKTSPAPATNISLSTIIANVANTGVGVASGIVGIPQVAQSGQQLLSLSNTSAISNRYATLELQQLKPLPGVKYADFRQRRVFGNTTAATLLRLDGTSAALRSRNGRTAIFAAATANPYGGAYSVFNLDGAGLTGYGWGNHDDPYAIRNDFTLRSHVATRWVTTGTESTVGSWQPLKFNAPEKYIPFRGDRVNVIDFGKRVQKNAYVWNPQLVITKEGKTQDFIKFYLTGPAILPSGAGEDDIIVFRATLGSLSDSFAANWTPVTMLGRADANQHYGGYSRDVSLDFVVYATDRDELKPIWRKLNALAGYTAPIYNNNFSLGAPWMRITIGDLFRQQPVVLTSLSYTLVDGDTTWEINIEDDPEMMQVPHKVSVSCQFTYIGNELPQHGGRFYSLAKQYDEKALPLRGNDNWLSGFNDNSDAIPIPRKSEVIKGTSTQTEPTTTKELKPEEETTFSLFMNNDAIPEPTEFGPQLPINP